MKQKLKQKREMKEYKVKVNLQQQMRSDRERVENLKEKMDEKSRAKTTVEFENEQRKEITRLKHLDHEDNFKREKNLHNLYKVRLIEKIEEKKKKELWKLKSKETEYQAYFIKEISLRFK